jgi:soluble lytic murein transglycosylase
MFHKEEPMLTNFSIRKVDHPPHSNNSKKNRHAFSIALFSLLLITSLSLPFHFPNLPGIQIIAAGYQKIERTIEYYPALKFTYSLINPEFQKKQEAILEILAVIEKHETGLAKVMTEELAEVIYEEATRYNHDPKFILALIAAESSFQNWSVSERGAKGLMQIMPYVAESIACELGIEWSGDRTLFNPFLNIKMGVHYLSRLLFDFKDTGLALTAYNYGPTYVKGLIEKKRKVPQHFYEKIFATYHDLVVSTNRKIPLADDTELIDSII